MSLPDFLRFTPVRLRAQHNGWTPGLQLRFLLALARGSGPDAAARALGRTRQSVYRLRNRPDAESFAAAWDRAQAFARCAARAGRSPAAGFGGIETVLVPRYYRGRLVGFVQREDLAGAMRLLGRLDRLAERLGDVPHGWATDEALEAFAKLAGSRSDRGDGMALANASTSSTPAEVRAALDDAAGGSPPYARVRVKDNRPA